MYGFLQGDFWFCQNCGSAVVSEGRPLTCPICYALAGNAAWTLEELTVEQLRQLPRFDYARERRCRAVTRQGKPCRHFRLEGDVVCKMHRRLLDMGYTVTVRQHDHLTLD